MLLGKKDWLTFSLDCALNPRSGKETVAKGLCPYRSMVYCCGSGVRVPALALTSYVCSGKLLNFFGPQSDISLSGLLQGLKEDQMSFKDSAWAGRQWLTPIILATQEAETRKIQFQS
jgi:hypothetical protein